IVGTRRVVMSCALKRAPRIVPLSPDSDVFEERTFGQLKRNAATTSTSRRESDKSCESGRDRARDLLLHETRAGFLHARQAARRGVVEVVMNHRIRCCDIAQ